VLELRVLHGPQAGSRLQLGVGEYLLGSGDDCTIILSGPRIEEEHAIIVFDGDEIAIRPIDGSVCDAQGNDIEAETVLALGLPVELGGVWLAVDRVDAPWPAAEAVGPMPRALQVDAEDADEPKAPVHGSADAHAEALLQQAASDQDQQEQLPAKQSAQVRGKQWLRGWRPAHLIVWRPRLALAAALLCSLVAIGVAAASWLTGLGDKQELIDPPEVITQAAKKPPPALLAILEKQGLTNRLKVLPDAGEWVVEGYLPSSAARNALSDAFGTLEQRPVLRIINEEELVGNANNFLAKSNKPASQLLRAENVGAGTVRITGAASSIALVNAADEAMRLAVPGILKVESTVLFPDQLAGRLREQLAAADLAGRIKTVEERPEMILEGTLTAEETSRWESVLVDFSRTYGSVLPIRASIGRVKPRLPVNVQAIVGGRTPYIVTESGEKVNTGGDINGHTLLMVRDAEVVFEGSKRIRMAR
ncbi:MAG: type III secretion system inner membrane ring subunit SctD, partial [Lacisediminimonas sp.]|nr:type III secretion system inner membrane ring subunit SctD [Lacisediminimonas sp.]